MKNINKIISRRFAISCCLLLVGASTLQCTANAQAIDVGAKRDVTVLTRNLYVGADFSPVVLALAQGNLSDIPALVSTAYEQIVASDFPTRAKALAAEIGATRPELVGLQEVSLIRTQFPGLLITGQATPATDVAYDYLEILLAQLRALGIEYAAVTAVTNLDVQLPNDRGLDVRLTDRDVILARADLPPGHLRLSNPQAANFAVNLTIPAGDGAVTVFRGWCAVDVFLRGRNFRFINSHFDDASLLIRHAQAAELLSGPANVSAPVILAGDFNSPADPPTQVLGGGKKKGDANDAYALFLDAGFADAWRTQFPGIRGDTCCQAADLQNDTSILDTRIDLVLFRGPDLSLESVDLLGETPSDRIISLLVPDIARLLWPSDHGGVVASVAVH